MMLILHWSQAVHRTAKVACHDRGLRREHRCEGKGLAKETVVAIVMRDPGEDRILERLECSIFRWTQPGKKDFPHQL